MTYFFFFLPVVLAGDAMAGFAPDFEPLKTLSQFWLNFLLGADRTIGPDIAYLLL